MSSNKLKTWLINMEGNKDDALKCRRLAEKCLREGNKEKALKLLEKSLRLYPTKQVEGWWKSCCVHEWKRSLSETVGCRNRQKFFVLVFVHFSTLMFVLNYIVTSAGALKPHMTHLLWIRRTFVSSLKSRTDRPDDSWILQCIDTLSVWIYPCLDKLISLVAYA